MNRMMMGSAILVAALLWPVGDAVAGHKKHRHYWHHHHGGVNVSVGVAGYGGYGSYYYLFIPCSSARIFSRCELD
jgi:hypothetical protein